MKYKLQFKDKDAMWDFQEKFQLSNYNASNSTFVLECKELTEEQQLSAINWFKATITLL